MRYVTGDLALLALFFLFSPTFAHSIEYHSPTSGFSMPYPLAYQSPWMGFVYGTTDKKNGAIKIVVKDPIGAQVFKPVETGKWGKNGWWARFSYPQLHDPPGRRLRLEAFNAKNKLMASRDLHYYTSAIYGAPAQLHPIQGAVYTQQEFMGLFWDEGDNIGCAELQPLFAGGKVVIGKPKIIKKDPTDPRWENMLPAVFSAVPPGKYRMYLSSTSDCREPSLISFWTDITVRKSSKMVGSQ